MGAAPAPADRQQRICSPWPRGSSLGTAPAPLSDLASVPVQSITREPAAAAPVFRSSPCQRGQAIERSKAARCPRHHLRVPLFWAGAVFCSLQSSHVVCISASHHVGSCMGCCARVAVVALRPSALPPLQACCSCHTLSFLTVLAPIRLSRLPLSCSTQLLRQPFTWLLRVVDCSPPAGSDPQLSRQHGLHAGGSLSCALGWQPFKRTQQLAARGRSRTSTRAASARLVSPLQSRR